MSKVYLLDSLHKNIHRGERFYVKHKCQEIFFVSISVQKQYFFDDEILVSNHSKIG